VVVGDSDPRLGNQCFTSAPDNFRDPTGNRFHGQAQSPIKVKTTERCLVHLQGFLCTVFLLLVLDARERAIVHVTRNMQSAHIMTQRCPVRFALLDDLLL